MEFQPLDKMSMPTVSLSSFPSKRKFKVKKDKKLIFSTYERQNE